MNRSILIVICDFLLVSLLAFSTVDISKTSSNEAPPPPNFKLDLSAKTNQADISRDLTAVMRIALEDERKNRDSLMGELVKSRAAASQREQEAGNLQKQLQARDEQAQRLSQQQNELLAQFAAAQTNMLALNQQLQTASTETAMSREKLAAMEAEARKQAEKSSALQDQLSELSRSNQVIQTEKQQLSTQLQVAEVEKRSAAETAARMQDEVKVEREEKAKLAEGVTALATKSSQLAEEIKQNQSMAPNTIFNQFVTNRVEAHFSGVRSGVFGDTTKRKDTETVLVTDGTNIYALCHVQDTPLTIISPGTDWEALTGILARNIATVPIHTMSFSLSDPRLVLMQITPAEAKELGGQPYRLAPDPFRFQDAVLVGAREDYYGQCKFQIDLSTPDYLKLDNSFIKGLFGKFNPSRGDFVFSQNGELLGVMANSTYCLMIQNFRPAATFQFGDDVRQEHTGDALSRLYALVMGLPFKLQ
jgi:hypothetical protein